MSAVREFMTTNAQCIAEDKTLQRLLTHHTSAGASEHARDGPQGGTVLALTRLAP